MHIPTWIPGFATRLFEVFYPKRPHLTVELHEICEDKIVASLDASGYTVDLYIFLRVWVVNTKEVPTVPKEWILTVAANSHKLHAERVPDISKWHQHSKLKKQQHGLTLIEDIRDNLSPLSGEPLQHGIPSEGWICFVVHGTKDTLLQGAALHLTLVDSFGRKHLLKSSGPWKCKGSMVNPEMLY
jgi:hypothetical protein